MAKSITIQEGGVARTLSGVEKIVTSVVGGGTQNWVPEDEASDYVNTGELSVNENGIYNSADDGYIGYSTVEVNVEPELVTKSITQNGTYHASDDGAVGYSSVEVDVTGGSGELTTKDITANGTYNARDDEADGYSSVTVNVEPQTSNTGHGTTPSGRGYQYGVMKIYITNNSDFTLTIKPKFTITNA